VYGSFAEGLELRTVSRTCCRRPLRAIKGSPAALAGDITPTSLFDLAMSFVAWTGSTAFYGLEHMMALRPKVPVMLSPDSWNPALCSDTGYQDLRVTLLACGEFRDMRGGTLLVRGCWELGWLAVSLNSPLRG
jgi:hypothetical protein